MLLTAGLATHRELGLVFVRCSGLHLLEQLRLRLVLHLLIPAGRQVLVLQRTGTHPGLLPPPAGYLRTAQSPQPRQCHFFSTNSPLAPYSVSYRQSLLLYIIIGSTVHYALLWQ